MPHNVPLSQDVFDVMHTMRAMRRLKPDPVPDELIFKILRAGQAAASGGNTQRWKFLVLKNAAAKKKAVQGFYKKLFDEVVGPRYASSPVPPGVKPDSFKRQHSAVEYLTDHYHEAPVWIVACLEGENPNRSAGSSIYPAVQNMLLAARALGLGSTLTTRHTGYGKECDDAMGIPKGYMSYAILPIGWPMGNFGPLGRGPLSEVVYLDHWGKPYPGLK
jgi:nitroreductase